ncbi:extracellular calcium-sensing receptor-like [Chanos chanos]|uniref:Extracellular calcium-sensing receptor-like n=1 Tax=Chanos chanos TaxID=29144 RepID=A0A6J2UM70_CHACN|nr:extracellular calcium-sensing receptor-like [Chanos chanos]
MPSLLKEGDIMIGGIFPIFNKQDDGAFSFEEYPSQVKCKVFDLRAFRWTQVMMFAIDEINKDHNLLPNISLGYKILDSCSSPANALRAALTLASEPDGMESSDQCHPPISALVGEAGSSQSIAVAETLGPFGIPVVSYFSTCACLSDKQKYPTFFRTIPSDYNQAKALASLVKKYEWNWIGVIQSDNDYGRNGILAFTEEVQRFGVCIAFTTTVLRTYPHSKILEVVDIIKYSTARVILAFVPEGDIYPLMKELVKQDITGIQWIASEAWITAAKLSTPEMFKSFGGTVGFAVQKMSIPKLQPFLTSISPYTSPPCLGDCNSSYSNNATFPKQLCSREENLDYTDVFFNVTQLRVSYNVYKAVYAIAHALHHMLFCETAESSNLEQCFNASHITPKQVNNYLKTVQFVDAFGETVLFDENGDPPPSYDIINWQLKDGEVQHVTVGQFRTSGRANHEFTIREGDIIWSTGKLVPKAVCSEICPTGTRKAQIKGMPACCFYCIPCTDGSIANTTADCFPCPQDYWSNTGRNNCILKTAEFLSYKDPLGIALTVMSLFGVCLSLTTFVVFIYFRNTPIVKASNPELSLLLLFSLFLCFLCPLTFIGEPGVWTCMLRHTVFSITFALCISCVLGKTIVVVIAFRNTLPGNNTAMKFGLLQQRLIVCSCAVVQIFICLIWLKISPPFPNKSFKYNNKKIILECNPGSDAAFCVVLGYIGLLSGICLVLAFLARKLPDNFNEAKFITFSMFIFCAVWLAFIPAYVSSPGKFTVAVEIFAILSSAFGVMVCIFGPKCYIILMKPERNTRKHITRKIPRKDF